MDFSFVNSAYSGALEQAASQIGISVGFLTTIITFITIWIFVWKGLALWKAAIKKQKIIFVLLLIVNDFGLLELLYYFWLSKIGENKKEIKSKKIRKK
jgi:hypothetical protein